MKRKNFGKNNYISFSLLIFFGIFLSAIGLMFLRPILVHADIVTWDGGGGDMSWCTATNWSNDLTPSSTVDIILDVNGTVITSACGTIDFGSLTIGGTNTTTLELVTDIGIGQNITLTNKGTLIQKNSTQQILSGTLTIESGGVLTHADNSTTQDYIVNFFANDIDIQAGGSVDVDHLGFDGGVSTENPPPEDGYGNGGGQGTTWTAGLGGAGAGHCGGGGAGGPQDYFLFVGGLGYCDMEDIDTIGSGGGATANGVDGGSGGGLIILEASGTATISGSIYARGSVGEEFVFYNNYGGGGSGGAVKITADAIAGTPENFDVSGGSVNITRAGGGGGGCVSLHYTTNNSLSYTNIILAGGAGKQYGGSGILYIQEGSNDGDLFLNNSGHSGADSQHEASLTVASITLLNNATYSVTSTRSMTLTGADPLSGSDSTAVFKLGEGGTLTTPSVLTISNHIQIYEDSTWINSSSTEINIVNGGTLEEIGFSVSSDPLWFSTTTIQSGGLITHADNSTTQANILNIKFNSLIINSGGEINVDGRGYDGGGSTGGWYEDGYGSGAGQNNDNSNLGAGGGHGGTGGDSREGGEDGGSTYCSVYSPQTMGSGGSSGNTSPGGAGGGLIILQVVNDLTVNGSITADGTDGTGTYGGGGGAGGGIWLRVGDISGTFTEITADGGGDSRINHGGGGGGGCIFVYYGGDYNLNGSFSVVGGITSSFSSLPGEDGSFIKNQEPRITFNSFNQKTDGTGDVLFNLDISDADLTDDYDDPASVKIEYKAGADCSTDLSDPTLDESSLAYSQGTPILNNLNDYQLSSVTTTPTTNIVSFDWQSKTDEASADGVYCVVLTSYDGISSSTFSATTTLDNVVPTAPGDLTVSVLGSDNVTLDFGTTSIDTNFDQYKVFYSTSSPVTRNNTEINSSTVSALGFINYNNITNFSIASLLENTTYFVNIWAQDLFGWLANAVEATFTTIISGTPGVNISPTSITLGEGDSSSYTVVLAKQPTASVTVNITESSVFISLSTTSIIFTTSTWDTPISVTISSLDDDSNNGIQAISITHSATSTDLDYNGISISLLNISLSDNDDDGPGPGTDPVYPIGNIFLNNNTEYINTTTVHITASSTNATDIALAEALYLGNGIFGNCNFINPFLAVFTDYDFQVSDGDGSKRVCARFKSVTGHTVDDVKNIILDTEKPILSNVIVDTTGIYPKFSGSVTDNNSNNIQIHVSSTEGRVFTSGIVNGNWQLNFPFYTPGQYNAEVYALDIASNTSDIINKDFTIAERPIEDCSAYPPDTIEIKLNSEIIPQNGTGLVEFIRLDNGDISNGRLSFKFKAGCPYEKIIYSSANGSFYSFAQYSFINPGDKYYKICSWGVDAKIQSERIIYTAASAFYSNFLNSYRSQVHNLQAPLPDEVRFFFGIVSYTGVFTYGNPTVFQIKETPVGDYCSRQPQPESCYNDQDKDTIADIYDNCPYNANTDQLDVDEDGFGNVCDNCPELENDGQLDSDGDDIGDVCEEPDQDEDSIPDKTDNCPMVANRDQKDTDTDKIGDACDSCPNDPENDIDQDGLCADVDNCPNDNNPGQEDEDEDGVGDVCEEIGPEDKCPDDPNKTSPGFCGCNNPETCDVCPNDPDKRFPGVCGCDTADVDSDGDGIFDCKDKCPNDPDNKCDEETPPCIGPDCDPDDPTPCVGSDCEIINNDGGGSENIINNIIEVLKDLPDLIITKIPEFFNTIGDNLVIIAEKIINVVRKVIDNPKVEAVNKKYIAPSLVAVGVANVAVGLQFSQLLTVLRSIFIQPLLLSRLKKKKKWGVIYNAFTKDPISLATIRVLDNETNKIVRTQVTDSQGRYLLVLEPGTYKIEVDKLGFVGFSEYLNKKKEDAKYINLYHGGTITVLEKSTDVDYNIPLDPSGKNKEITKLLRDKLLGSIKYIVSFSGLALTAVSFIITPTVVIVAFFFAHLLFFSLVYKFSHSIPPPHLGKVTDTENGPIENVVVRIFDSTYNKLVNSAITNHKGQYAVLVGPSTYYATYEKPGYLQAKTNIIDLSSEKTDGMGGIIDVNKKLIKR